MEKSKTSGLGSPTVDQLYYLQDSRSFAGNNIIWWAKNKCGYTSDLKKAHVFEKDSAVRQNKRRATDIPWPKEYIDSKIHPVVVDIQYVKIKEALMGTGVKLAKEKRHRKPVVNCIGCGRFLTVSQVYDINCPNCETDNLP